jgi:hypothetical protein
MECLTPQDRESWTTISDSSRPREPKWRLQFSLRLLLLTITATGIGLAIFRWPWEEVHHGSSTITTTNYRRGWNGKALRHGPAEVRQADGSERTESIYHDGVLIREREFRPENVLVEERLFFPELGETLVRRYETVRGESLIVESRQSLQSGRTSTQWKTAHGTTLQSYEYGPGAPHRWNGRSIDEGLHDVFMNRIANESVRAEWQRPQSSYDSIGYVYLGDGTFCGIRTTNQTKRLDGIALEGKLLGETWLHVQGTDSTQLSDAELFYFNHNLNLNLRTDDHPLPAVEVLLHRVFRQGYTLVPRFGVVCVVPICSAELASEDPTGVMQVQFSEDSSQQKEWLDLQDSVVRDSSRRQRIEKLFAGSSIEIDASAVTDTQPLPFRRRATPAPHLRSRRDILGLCLWYHGYRVEQEGNKLTVLPQAAKKPGP